MQLMSVLSVVILEELMSARDLVEVLWRVTEEYHELISMDDSSEATLIDVDQVSAPLFSCQSHRLQVALQEKVAAETEEQSPASLIPRLKRLFLMTRISFDGKVYLLEYQARCLGFLLFVSARAVGAKTTISEACFCHG